MAEVHSQSFTIRVGMTSLNFIDLGSHFICFDFFETIVFKLTIHDLVNFYLTTLLTGWFAALLLTWLATLLASWFATLLASWFATLLASWFATLLTSWLIVLLTSRLLALMAHFRRSHSSTSKKAKELTLCLLLQFLDTLGILGEFVDSFL